MFALILDTLGSTELLFILVIALIFFGPRKLPQLAHSIGKSLAEFRKASEDFKKTWEREVAMESARLESQDNQIGTTGATAEPVGTQSAAQPAVEAVTPEWVVPRENAENPSIATTHDNNEGKENNNLSKDEWS